MKLRCYADCRFMKTSHYDPSPAGVALGGGYYTESECSKDSEFSDDVEEIENSDNINKHDGHFKRCPFYKPYTKAELREARETERAYEKAMDDAYRQEEDRRKYELELVNQQ